MRQKSVNIDLVYWPWWHWQPYCRELTSYYNIYNSNFNKIACSIDEHAKTHIHMMCTNMCNLHACWFLQYATLNLTSWFHSWYEKPRRVCFKAVGGSFPSFRPSTHTHTLSWKWQIKFAMPYPPAQPPYKPPFNHTPL